MAARRPPAPDPETTRILMEGKVYQVPVAVAGRLIRLEIALYPFAEAGRALRRVIPTLGILSHASMGVHLLMGDLHAAAAAYGRKDTHNV